MTIRQALIRNGNPDAVAAYLPSNYAVTGNYDSVLHGPVVVIAGEDRAGWTLDDYVLPRLASGLMFGSEIIQEVPA